MILAIAAPWWFGDRLDVNCTTDTKYCKIATQKLNEQLISLKKTLGLFRVMRDKIVCES